MTRQRKGRLDAQVGAVILGTAVLVAGAVAVAQMRDEIGDLESERDSMTSALNELQRAATASEARVAELEADIRSKERALRSAEDQVSDLESEVADLEAAAEAETAAPVVDSPVSSTAPSVYLAPDPATVRQFIRSVYRERLGWDPDEEELQQEVSWYLAEDREGGDTAARWLERFDERHAEYIQREREADARHERIQECEREKAERRATGEETYYPCV